MNLARISDFGRQGALVFLQDHAPEFEPGNFSDVPLIPFLPGTGTRRRSCQELRLSRSRARLLAPLAILDLVFGVQRCRARQQWAIKATQEARLILTRGGKETSPNGLFELTRCGSSVQSIAETRGQTARELPIVTGLKTTPSEALFAMVGVHVGLEQRAWSYPLRSADVSGCVNKRALRANASKHGWSELGLYRIAIREILGDLLTHDFGS